MSDLRSGTGSSTALDSYTAGSQAARAAVAGLGEERARLVMVYTSVKYDLQQLLNGVRSVTGDAPLAGATSAGHMVEGAYTPPGVGVGVIVLGGDRYRFGVGSAEGMAADPEGVGERLVARARSAALDSGVGIDGGDTGSAGALGSDDGDPKRPHAAVVLLTDGLGGDGQRVLRGVHRVAGSAVPVVGGAAGDDRRMVAATVMHDDLILSNGAVGIWITSPQPLVVTAAHGWTAISDPEVITRADGLVIHEIGGRPALQLYSEYARTGEVGAQLAQDGESQASYGLGIIEPDGSHRVRGVYAVPGDALGSFAAVEEFSAVQVMTADADAVMGTVRPVVAGSVAALQRPAVVLVFDCIGRADILGPAVAQEAAAISAAAEGAEVFGFYGYGEYARIKGAGGTHNAALCALAL